MLVNLFYCSIFVVGFELGLNQVEAKKSSLEEILEDFFTFEGRRFSCRYRLALTKFKLRLLDSFNAIDSYRERKTSGFEFHSSTAVVGSIAEIITVIADKIIRASFIVIITK